MRKCDVAKSAMEIFENKPKKKGGAEMQKKTPAIFLIMQKTAADDFFDNVIMPSMRSFKNLEYVAVLIEDDDSIRNLLTQFDPRVFIFDNELKYRLGNELYETRGLMLKLMQRFQNSFGLMFTEHSNGRRCEPLDGTTDEHNSNIVWFKKNSKEKNACPRNIAVELVLRKAFTQFENEPKTKGEN